MDRNTNGVSPELAERAKAAKTEEDLQALVREEGHGLSDEQLEGIAGGDKMEDQRSRACPSKCWDMCPKQW